MDADRRCDPRPA